MARIGDFLDKRKWSGNEGSRCLEASPKYYHNGSTIGKEPSTYAFKAMKHFDKESKSQMTGVLPPYSNFVFKVT